MRCDGGQLNISLQSQYYRLQNDSNHVIKLALTYTSQDGYNVGRKI